MAEALISDYLGRLEAAAWPLPASRRSELTAEVREHIENALSEAGSRDETTVRNVLDRLGRPEEIVAAEVDPASAERGTGSFRSPSQAATGWMAEASARGWGGIEIASVLLLTVGALLLSLVGPIAGAVLAWFSPRWSAREKKIASVIVGGALAIEVVPIVVFTSSAFGGFGGFGGSGFPFLQSPGLGFGILGLIAFAVGFAAVAVRLGRRRVLGARAARPGLSAAAARPSVEDL